MQSFRLAHAGVVLEREGASLFIDPGSFTTTAELQQALNAALPIAAVVITHEHGDHWTPEHVAAIRHCAPHAPIFTTAATAQALAGHGIDSNGTTVRAGDEHRGGPFGLEFYGRDHAVLHSSIPVIDNIGVMVGESFAWGGDALVAPPRKVAMLGVPIGSPWSNIGEVLDFVLQAAPQTAYLTHDEMLSPAGKAMYEARVTWALQQGGGSLQTFARIDTDEAARTVWGD